MSSDTIGCVGTSIRLRSGRYLDLVDPQPGQFTFDDIAGALSKLCRFGGQVNRFFSIAEHSVNCARQARADGLSVECQRACLMHDASEAFLGDVVKPLKLLLPEYGDLEDRVQSVIGRKFDIDFAAHWDHVSLIDHQMLFAERRALFSADDVAWTGESGVRVLDVATLLDCRPPTPERAEAEFWRTAYTLDIRTDV